VNWIKLKGKIEHDINLDNVVKIDYYIETKSIEFWYSSGCLFVDYNSVKDCKKDYDRIQVLISE
jgi:hypothetical protein